MIVFINNSWEYSFHNDKCVFLFVKHGKYAFITLNLSHDIEEDKNNVYYI
jgi:hypothetical protein